ncbi:MAG: TadE/TadG family type IV pilus assembly protein, partial [Planctomycetaceae bacterium]
VFAGIEFSHLATIRSTTSNAAYEAARTVAVPGADVAEAKAEAGRILAIVGVRNFDVTVSPDPIDASTQAVTVNVKVPYSKNAILAPMFTGNLTLNADATLRTERYSGIPPATP